MVFWEESWWERIGGLGAPSGVPVLSTAFSTGESSGARSLTPGPLGSGVLVPSIGSKLLGPGVWGVRRVRLIKQLTFFSFLCWGRE